MRLSHRFTDLDTRLVARVVWETYRHFDDHPSREVVPILVQDAAQDRMRVMPMTTRRTDPGGGGRPRSVIGPLRVSPGRSVRC